jgi:putative membrane protein
LLSVYFKGIAMGAADAVPGVSGGTIALITGIYDRLLGAITALDLELVRAALGARQAGQRTRLVHLLEGLDLKFLLALGLGILSAIVGLAGLITLALERFPALTFSFFFGLIGASALALGADLSIRSRLQLPSGVAGFSVAFLLTGDGGASLTHSPVVVFGSGAIAISAMVLPGISGSFLLLLLGQYEFVFGTLAAFITGVTSVDPGQIAEHGVVIVTFGAGAVIGLLTTARIVEAALDRARAITLTFLISLMVGALRLPVARVMATGPELTLTGLAPLVVVAIVGAISVLTIYRVSSSVV